MSIRLWQVSLDAFVYWGMGTLALSTPTMPFAHSQPRPEPGVRRFTLVLRVVRPRWRDTYAIPAPTHPHTLTGNLFTIAHAESDAEFLKELRVNNDYFTFDAVVSKRVVNLRGDQGWQAPADFTRQKTWLAVVDKNQELLRNHLPDSKTINGQKANPKDAVGSSSHFALPSTYKFNLTEDMRQKLLHKGQLLVSYRITQYYASPSGPVEYHDSDLVQFMDNGKTFCMGIVLPVVNSKGQDQFSLYNSETLLPSDVIFATVTEIK